MVLLLDTDVLIEFYQGSQGVIDAVKELRRPNPDNPAITFAQYAEFMYGFQDKNTEKQQRAKEFLHRFTYLPDTPRAAQRFTAIRHDLDQKGEPIPILDVFIAAIAIEKGVTVVTIDDHFNHIPDLSAHIIEP